MTKAPEFSIIVFSFLLHFVWEFWQVPTYAEVAELNHWDGIKLCTSATFGDAGIAAIAFCLTSYIAKNRLWFLKPSTSQMLVFVGIGIALTLGFEYYYINISQRLSYSELMPLIPVLGVGLSPLVQWLIIPVLVLWLTKRQLSIWILTD